MTLLRIFISSRRSEVARERETRRGDVRKNPLMRRFFDVFPFEDGPASNRRPDELYPDEVERCDVYDQYGVDWGEGNQAPSAHQAWEDRVNRPRP